MTNEEAAELLKRFQSRLDPLSEFELMSALSIAIAALRNQPEWTPCSKGLPNFGEPVITTMDDETIEINHRFDIDGRRGWFWNTVVAWIPLPKPYRGGKA